MVRHKKSLGQHFLREDAVSKSIADALVLTSHSRKVLEVGPGEGMLTQFLLEKPGIDLTVVELDRRLPELLLNKFPQLEGKVIEADILKMNLAEWTKEPFSLIGNYPYNISSQILFKVIENREQITQMVGMFQKEVAKRIAAKSGNKAYGILSILTQVYYQVDYLFDVPPEAFVPPPRVFSGVIRLERSAQYDEKFDYKDLAKVVKTAFNQRRKKLSNALKSLQIDQDKLDKLGPEILSKRPDNLSVEDYLHITEILFG